jgi:uncharacterized protein (DUF4415 family)
MRAEARRAGRLGARTGSARGADWAGRSEVAVSPDARPLERFKRGGEGNQTRIDTVLREHVESNSR